MSFTLRNHTSKMDLRFLFLLAFFASTSQGLYVHLSESIPSTLYYRGGSCTWRLSGIIAGHDFLVNSPHIVLEGLDTGVEVSCEVNGTVLLQTVIIWHDTLPPPHNLTLDTVNKRLQWDHPFLPQLPPLFELVHGFTITYQVYGRVGGVPSLSVAVFSNYLDFTSESVNHCVEYEFVVQSVSNISDLPPSQNSSAVSGNFSTGVPSFRNLSANLGELIHHPIYPIHVTFVLEKKDCPGTYPTFFIVTLEGFGEHRFDINSTHIDDGGGTFLLPPNANISNACHLQGILFGGNDAGNCTACEIPISKELDCVSVVMPGGTTAISTVMDPSSSSIPPQESSDVNRLPYVIGAAGGATALLIAAIVSGVIVVLVCIKLVRKHKTGHHLDPPMQTNQAYVTVVRSSGKVKTQPCPAYELAVIEQ